MIEEEKKESMEWKTELIILSPTEYIKIETHKDYPPEVVDLAEYAGDPFVPLPRVSHIFHDPKIKPS